MASSPPGEVWENVGFGSRECWDLGESWDGEEDEGGVVSFKAKCHPHIYIYIYGRMSANKGCWMKNANKVHPVCALGEIPQKFNGSFARGVGMILFTSFHMH